MTCSLDLRQRAVDRVKLKRETQAQVAERFCISVSSLKRWLNRATLVANKPGPKQSRTIDSEALMALVKQNPDAYLDEYAQELGSNTSTISYNLQKLGISRKKNHTIQRKKRKKAHAVSTGH